MTKAPCNNNKSKDSQRRRRWSRLPCDVIDHYPVRCWTSAAFFGSSGGQPCVTPRVRARRVPAGACRSADLCVPCRAGEVVAQRQSARLSSGGQGFDSSQLHQMRLAQWIEHRTVNPGVVGSSPASPSFPRETKHGEPAASPAKRAVCGRDRRQATMRLRAPADTASLQSPSPGSGGSIFGPVRPQPGVYGPAARLKREPASWLWGGCRRPFFSSPPPSGEKVAADPRQRGG